jgi:hypothetical protein
MVVQPPSRRTLVNVPTNLYTKSNPTILSTSVLGQPVRVRATPAEFRWTYGDDSTRTTSDPGGPYPILRTAHVYRKPQTATLTLTTTYTGEYSVAGGPWQDIEGTASVASPPAEITVLAAESELVNSPEK